MKPARAVFVMCLAEIAGMAGYAGFVAQVPLLSREWGLSASAIGWISGAFYAGYMFAVPILVTLTDRIDPRRIYFFSMTASATSTLTFCTSPPQLRFSHTASTNTCGCSPSIGRIRNFGTCNATRPVDAKLSSAWRNKA